MGAYPLPIVEQDDFVAATTVVVADDTSFADRQLNPANDAWFSLGGSQLSFDVGPKAFVDRNDRKPWLKLLAVAIEPAVLIRPKSEALKVNAIHCKVVHDLVNDSYFAVNLVAVNRHNKLRGRKETPTSGRAAALATTRPVAAKDSTSGTNAL